MVHYQQQGHTVGYAARDNAAQDTANTISSVKRMMGRSLADIRARYPHLPYRFKASVNGLPMIDTAAGLLNPVRVSADILKALAARASESLSGELDGVVITVPAYFDDAQRQERKTPRGWQACMYCACSTNRRRRRLPTVWTQAKKALSLFTISAAVPSISLSYA